MLLYSHVRLIYACCNLCRHFSAAFLQGCRYFPASGPVKWHFLSLIPPSSDFPTNLEEIIITIYKREMWAVIQWSGTRLISLPVKLFFFPDPESFFFFLLQPWVWDWLWIPPQDSHQTFWGGEEVQLPWKLSQWAHQSAEGWIHWGKDTHTVRNHHFYLYMCNYTVYYHEMSPSPFPCVSQRVMVS